jgi:ribonuclease HII
MTKRTDLSHQSIAELRAMLLDRGRPLPIEIIESLAHDPRQGVQQLVRQACRIRSEDQHERHRLRRLQHYEALLRDQGVDLIAGVDEAGVGPLAGPVVASAVILPKEYELRGLKDSKKIPDESKRKELAARIQADAVCWAVGRAEVEEIDRLNIYHAGLLAMQRAVQNLSIRPHYLLVDARTVPDCPIPQQGIVHGDALSATIAAASIIAKTTRDALMEEFDKIYPGYNFAAHKGYPTPEHCRLLAQLGPLPIHRRSFGPVRVTLGTLPRQAGLFS